MRFAVVKERSRSSVLKGEGVPLMLWDAEVGL